jgi:DNA topoisomerase-1
MEEIRERRIKPEEVLKKAREVLKHLLSDFKEKEKTIGEGLRTTFTETRAMMIRVGDCPSCGKGSLVLRKGKFGQFVACERYPECTTTFKLPSSGHIEVTPNTCEKCKYPVVRMIRKAKRPQEVCINPDCPSKAVVGFNEHPCPKCKEGTVILRKSVYGAFGACNKFPKCRYVERIKSAQSSEQAKSAQSPQQN